MQKSEVAVMSQWKIQEGACSAGKFTDKKETEKAVVDET